MSDNVTIGVNILETLTTGMYRDPLVVFREYIQNSCDSIDDAVESKLIKPNDGCVDIWIEENTVSIEDNGIGLSAADFRPTLYSIGESPKTAGRHKGFRGIGHWCGVAHCSTIVFTAKAAGETVESIMECDAEKMRSMMLDHRLKRARYSIDEVLSSTTKFLPPKDVGDIDAHYFKVKMLNVVDAKEELCHLQTVKDYLSFIVPVAYDTPFHFRTKIHDYASEIGQSIQEYNIAINGEDVRKKYRPSFTTRGKGDDTVTDVNFKEFRDDTGSLIAWMWFGVSSFKAQMIPANKMRGIRLRSQNIQIGSEDALQKLFKDSNGRGLYYYIGEVFAVSNELLPDSQRDYFEPGEARTRFERLLYDFFNDDLTKIYYAGSKVNAAFDKIAKAAQIKEEIANSASASEEQQRKLSKAQDEARIAEAELAKLREKTNAKLDEDNSTTAAIVVNEILKNNDKRHTARPPQEVSSKATPTTSRPVILPSQPPDKQVSLNKICAIIRALTDTATAETIIVKIKEELN